MQEKAKSASFALLSKAYEGMWRRGEEYVKKNQVMLTASDIHGARAIARGSAQYEVTLRFVGEGLARRCTCPYFEGRSAQHPPCKHIIAAAIVWDKERNLALPTKDDVTAETIPPPLVSRNDIALLFSDPLNADLETLRMAVEAGSYVKPHARLPSAPHMGGRESDAITLADVKRALKEMERWSDRDSFDPYFCAGEMTAALSEMIRTVRGRLLVTPLMVMVDALLLIQTWNARLMTSLIDDSDGLHEFTEAHLEDLYQHIVSRVQFVGDETSYRSRLEDYTIARGRY